MTNPILTAVIVAVVYFVMKFVEMRFVSKEPKPFKELMMDTLAVFIATIAAVTLLEQFNLGEMIGAAKAIPSAFVNKPDF